MATDVFAVVRLNFGQWVASCPRPGCANAEKLGRCDDGSTGGLAGDSFRCRPEYGGCGLVCHAQWPAADVIEKVEAFTRARPVPATRNWEPGESLSDLMMENVEHGIVPAAALRGETVTVIGDEVARGTLDWVARPGIEG